MEKRSEPPAYVPLQLAAPLRDCFLHCEVKCVRECCGIDAISCDPELIAAWGMQVGLLAVLEAQIQLYDLITAVEDRSQKVNSEFLNHFTCDEAARQELLQFLFAFRTGLLNAADSGKLV